MNRMFKFNVGDYYFSIDLKKYGIECIILYGSYALGTAEKNSDLDLMFIIDNCSSKEREIIQSKIARDLDVPYNWLNVYTKDFLIHKCNLGEYFLWHVRLDGKIIYSRSPFTRKTLGYLNRFTDVVGALVDDREYIDRCYYDFKKGHFPASAMAGAIAGRLRNSCIILCYLNGVIEFDKYGVVDRCYRFKNIRMPFSFKEYKTLYSLKQQNSKSYEVFDFDDSYYYIKTWYKAYVNFSEEVLEIADRKLGKDFKSPLEDL